MIAVFFSELRTEPRALCLLREHSITELNLQETLPWQLVRAGNTLHCGTLSRVTLKRFKTAQIHICND